MSTDVAFILDNTVSMGADALTKLVSGIGTFLDDLEILSGGDYRLALVTPDDDEVNVRLAFSQNNRSVFEAVLSSNLTKDGFGTPESTDECLNTVINALPASGRVNTEACQRAPLQINDFSPAFRSSSQVRRLVVLITDAPPGGFCDDFVSGIDNVRAHQYAMMARTNGCIAINAVQVALWTEAFDTNAEAVLRDYAAISCGWYSQVPHNAVQISECVSSMLYIPGACSCP